MNSLQLSVMSVNCYSINFVVARYGVVARTDFVIWSHSVHSILRKFWIEKNKIIDSGSVIYLTMSTLFSKLTNIKVIVVTTVSAIYRYMLALNRLLQTLCEIIIKRTSVCKTIDDEVDKCISGKWQTKMKPRYEDRSFT